MTKLFQWRMPPDYLREVRDATPLKSLAVCLISGVYFGVSASLILSIFFWKIRTPFPMEIVFIGIGVAFISTILRYWLMPFFSPSVVLLSEGIYLQYGRRTHKYRFPNITECRLRRVIGKTTHYSLMTVKSNLENETPLFRWRLREKIDIGIPDSVDRGRVEKILQDSGVKVVSD
jgi:hypothetical protein